MAPYTTSQQIYCLSSAANAVGSTAGTQAALQAAEENALRKQLPAITGGRWQLTWGPKVYKEYPEDDDFGPDNVWFAAVDDKQRICVIAIAGTAPESLLDWLGDASVYDIVNFDKWTAKWQSQGVLNPPPAEGDENSALIAYGTANFIVNILSNPSPAGCKSPGILIGDYIQAFQASHPDYTMVITGHSMGGAVAPALSLGLIQAHYITNTKQTVQVMPSAGPTPGNLIFNRNFVTTFPPPPPLPGTNFIPYNVDYYNPNDIVPQAWSADSNDDRNMNNITDVIYSDASYFTQGVLETTVNIGELLPGTTYSPLPGQSFGGTSIPDDIGIFDLGDEIAKQHTTAYWEAIGIEGFVHEFNKTLIAQPNVRLRKRHICKRIREYMAKVEKSEHVAAKGDTTVTSVKAVSEV